MGGEDGERFGAGVGGKVDVGDDGMVEGMRVGRSCYEDGRQASYLWHISDCWEDAEGITSLTISPSRARAGMRVGDASRWRSMPSRTSMNFSFPCSKCWSSTTKALMLSLRPSRLLASSSCPCSFKASFIEAIVRSRRCRVVMHSCDRTIVEGVSIASRNASTVRLLPVASTPWTTIVEGLGRLG